MFVELPQLEERMIRSVARFRLRAHT